MSRISLGGRKQQLKVSMDFKLQLLEAITNKFSEDQRVGSGVYGDVYRV